MPVKAVIDINQNGVIPAQAGIHVSVANAFVSRANFYTALLRWAPAFAGVTLERRVSDTVSARGYLSVILTMVGASINQNEVIPAQAGIHVSVANAFASCARCVSSEVLVVS
jgi:phosphotransferase system HPr-like phosphotransfer protein